MIAKRFVLAGKAIFTVEVPEGFTAEHGTKPHYTYLVKRKPASEKYPERFFVYLLTGPDNESDHTYLGMLDQASGGVELTRKSKMTVKSWPVRILKRVLGRLWADEPDAIEAFGWKVHHEGRCGKCRKLLTDPRSLETGFGPECAKRR